MWRQRTRALVAIAALLVPFLLIAALRQVPVTNVIAADPVVLLVGDLNTQASFGNAVQAGVIAAKTQQDHPAFRILEIQVADPSGSLELSSDLTLDSARSERLRVDLLRAIAAENVVAIISADTSSTAGTVIEVASTFQIPVLLAVATNAELLQLEHSTAIRLVPSDALQADTITGWCRETLRAESSDGPVRVGVLHDTTAYGLGLRAELQRRLSVQEMLPFPATNNIADALRTGQAANVNGWVVLGYESQAREFLAKKIALGIPGPVLLSDGCYGSWLEGLAPAFAGTWLSFPKSSMQAGDGSVDPARGLRGFGPFGYDAYMIMDAAIRTAISENTRRANFRSTIIASANRLSKQANALFAEYIIDSGGENAAAMFSVTEIDGEIP